MNINRLVLKREKEWKQLQELLSKVEAGGLKRLNESELSSFVKLYRMASTDLSYLQTHFRESRYTTYLNHLLSRCHNYIQIQDRSSAQKLKHFFSSGFPGLLFREKNLFILATLTFVLASLFAFFSIYMETPWADDLLSPQEKAMLENRASQIEDGEQIIPVAQRSPFTAFIMTNNLQVSFLAFAGGIFFGLGTIYILIVNGLMLGSLAAVYALMGESLIFWALILPHGITELLAIFITAAAGLLLGRALLVPGDYTRVTRLKQEGRKAVMLLIGTVPMFIIAAVIEGFITPAAFSSAGKLVFSGFTTVLLVYYFAWFPRLFKA